MSELLSPELFERIRGTKEGASWFAKLKEHAKTAGRDESDAAIEGEMRSKLSGLLEGLAEKYKNIKLGALEKITQLQERASAVIDSALHTKEPPDIEALQQLLRDLDEVLDDLETKLEDVKPEPAETQGRPASKPAGEPPAAKPGEKLGARYKLTKEQRAYFAAWKERAAGNKAELQRMRYERNKAVRMNRGDEPLSFAEYKRLIRKRKPQVNRRLGTKEARVLRPAVSDYVGRKLMSGDSFPTSTGKTSKFEITVELDGKQVTVRPDGVTLDASGKLEPEPVLQEHKFWRGGADGDEIAETDQTRAERKYAQDRGGQHIVSISADNPDLDGVPPRPRPDAVLGEQSEVVFVDRHTKKVTRVWSAAMNAWLEPK